MSVKYTARQALSDGTIPYTEADHEVWKSLFRRQYQILNGRACKEYIQGLKTLGLSADRIPQPFEVGQRLKESTGWSVEPVSAVIPANEFFTLLKEKKFPAASFIRTIDELDYLQEPDIFHEIFGHCPLLTFQPYADFVQKYGELSLRASKLQRKYLFRLFWFTVEFGLIETPEGRRIMGGGILSSYRETLRAADRNEEFQVKPFDIMTALRTPFRIDRVQPLYFALENFQQMYSMTEMDLLSLIEHATSLGDFPPTFEYNPENGHDRYN